ncbi:undecaprenyl-diphosphatase [Acinetobacter calcoaceticus]|uniref:undecaprenyl-diphosphate phosphatase n=1 Tax=Acinetobacter calcoaceticus TaxID=471 RepID=A0A4R1Y9T3_ACICA|nr:undecaprenyl-diphosphatase [Acinetobacter calcoaceticus]
MPYLVFILGCVGLSIGSIGLHLSSFQQLDHALLVWMSLERTPFLDVIAVFLSLFGGLPAVLLVSTLCCIWQIRSKNFSNIYFIVVGVLGSAVIGWVLKYAIHRPRPDFIQPMIETYGASFPSAHSIYAATLSALIVFIFHKHSRVRVIIFLACLWWIAMGISRIYLGAHYLTDVLAGWGIGFMWIAMLRLVFSQFIFKNKFI